MVVLRVTDGSWGVIGVDGGVMDDDRTDGDTVE